MYEMIDETVNERTVGQNEAWAHQTLPILPQVSPCLARRSHTRRRGSPRSSDAIWT